MLEFRHIKFYKKKLGKFLENISEIRTFTSNKEGSSQEKLVRKCIKLCSGGQKLVSLTKINEVFDVRKFVSSIVLPFIFKVPLFNANSADKGLSYI